MLQRRVPVWVTATVAGFMLLDPAALRRVPASARGFDRGSGTDEEEGRAFGGRGGAAPTTRPHGLKAVAFQVYDNISSHRVLAIAAGVTFYTILAVFPA